VAKRLNDRRGLTRAGPGENEHVPRAFCDVAKNRLLVEDFLMEANEYLKLLQT
jgi:hypothetical protein